MGNVHLEDLLNGLEPGTALENLPENVLQAAVNGALMNVNRVTSLRPNQFQTIQDIIQKKNIFKTAGTGSGKTLPPCLVPSVLRQLENSGFQSITPKHHTLFLTPLNSIRDSLILQLGGLGITASILSTNCPYDSSTDIHFVTPETLNNVISAIRENSSHYCCIVFDEIHQFASWSASGFRKVFTSLLYGGVVTMMGVPLLLQTATATVATRTFIKANIPEIKEWTDRFQTPARNDVTIIIPPPTELTGNVSSLIAPHIEDTVNLSTRAYTTLVIVRSVARGAEIFLQILHKLSLEKKHLIDDEKSIFDPYNRKVAFFHRNVTKERRDWILQDLTREESDPEKKLLFVVSTVYLSLGVDISVDRAIVFGLPEEIEGIPQEVGRVGRHRSREDQLSKRRSFIFYYHKGHAENFHCKLDSTSRQLISPMPACQTEQLYCNFDDNYKSTIDPCFCCYPHIKNHFDTTGCSQCKEILVRYCSKKEKKQSIVKKIKAGIEEFCESRKINKISCVNNDIQFSIQEFSDDLVKIYDEISGHLCLVKYYGIPVDVAKMFFSIIQESMNYVHHDDVIIDSPDQFETINETDVDSINQSGSEFSDID